MQPGDDPAGKPEDEDEPSKEDEESDDGSAAVGGNLSESVAPTGVLLAEVDQHGPVLKASPAKSSLARGGDSRVGKAVFSPSLPALIRRRPWEQMTV